MSQQPIAAAYGSRFYRLLLGGYSEILCTPGAIHLRSGRAKGIRVASEQVVKIRIDRAVFWRRLNLHLADGQVCIVGGVNQPAAAGIVKTVAEARAAHRKRAKRRAARIKREKRLAAELEKPLLQLDRRAKLLFDGTAYGRHSQAANLRERIAEALPRSLRKSVRQHLSSRAAAAFDRLWPLRSDDGFEQAREAANDVYVATQREAVRTAAHDLGYPPSAKGREADYAIVLDLKNDRRGFPSKIEDDPLMDLVLPRESEETVPHAEERRLFYVAATQARRGTYLVADPDRPSEFVVELLQSNPGLRQIGRLRLEPAPQCPRCDGALVASKSGKNLRCTYFPMCSHMAPRCTDCNRGFLLLKAGRTRSTTRACRPSARACPKCRAGVLTLNEGSAGRFWGCSDWLSEPPCGFTGPLQEGSLQNP